MAKERTERQIDRYNRYGSPLQWLGAVTVGLTSGAITLFNLVTTKFHNDMSNDFKLLDIFRSANEDLDLRKVFRDKVGASLPTDLLKFDEATVQKALKAPKFEVPAALRRPTAEETTGFLAHWRGAKGEYRNYVRRVTHFGLGIESYGVKGVTIGTFQRLMSFSPTSRFNTVVKSLFAVGGGIGATLMVFNQLNNRDKLNEIDKQTERSDRKIDAIIEKLGVEPDEIKTRLENKQSLKEAAKAEQERDQMRRAGKTPTAALAASSERMHERMQRDVAPELGV